MSDYSEKALSESIIRELEASSAVKQAMAMECIEALISAANMIVKALRLPGRKVLFCGNGGSAADCQHLTAEFIVRLSAKFNRSPLPAIALTTDTSILTACSNDFGFEEVFSRQVEALGNEGDVMVCISTSGNSTNVVKAAITARERGIKVIGFLGKEGGKLGSLMDVSINIPSVETNRIQEGHITAGHILVRLVEEQLFSGKYAG